MVSLKGKKLKTFYEKEKGSKSNQKSLKPFQKCQVKC
jgi:hypothetical protein